MSSLRLISAGFKMFNPLGKNIKVGCASLRFCGLTELTRRHKSSHQISEIEAKQLRHSYSVMVDNIINHHEFSIISFDDKQKLKEMVDYNLSAMGYLDIAYSVIQIHDNLNTNDQLPMDKRDSVYMMGLCCHMLHSSYEVLDDVLDNGLIRHKRPSWRTTKDGSGVNAISDAILLFGFPLLLLKQFFSHHKNYHQMVEVFNMLHVYSIMGQRLDCTKHSIEQMNMHRWLTITKFKASYHQAFMQFKLTLLLTDTYEQDKFKLMEPILMDAAVLIQMWNDYFDIFPQNSSFEKPPSDIQEGKCTWMIARALELCNSEQRRVLKENYGKKENSSVDKVQDVFKDLGLKELGVKFRNEFLQNMELRIDELPDDYPKLALKSGLNLL